MASFVSWRQVIRHDLFEWKLSNAMDGSVLHVSVSTNEALEVLRPASNDGSIIREEVLSIIAAYGSVDLLSWSMQCL